MIIRYLFDTDHLSLLEQRDPHVSNRFAASVQGEVATSSVNVFEALRGRVDRLTSATLKPIQRIVAFDQLLSTVGLLQQFPILRYDDEAESRFVGLTALRVKTGAQDLRIAAVALVHGVILVTRNTRDFRLVPGLILEDWSY